MRQNTRIMAYRGKIRVRINAVGRKLPDPWSGMVTIGSIESLLMSYGVPDRWLPFLGILGPFFGSFSESRTLISNTLAHRVCSFISALYKHRDPTYHMFSLCSIVPICVLGLSGNADQSNPVLDPPKSHLHVTRHMRL